LTGAETAARSRRERRSASPRLAAPSLSRSSLALTRAQYDQSVSTYSPDGRIYQVEYAVKAIEASGTSVGVRTADGGVLLACEKLLAAVRRRARCALLQKMLDELLALSDTAHSMSMLAFLSGEMPRD
jgi:hypothetical protein